MKTYKTEWLGQVFTYTDGILTIESAGKPKKELSKAEMQEISDEMKNTNRIYKPIALLFWTDCKNGKASNFELIKA